MKMSSPSFFKMGSVVGLGWALVATLTGCRREEVKSYRVPKEQASAPDAHQHQPGMPDGHPEIGNTVQPKLSWKLPDGWTETGAGQMSVASFGISGKGGQKAQVAITPLANMAGKESLIVNMWRQQVGLGELSESEAAKQLSDVDIGGASGKMFDMAGKSATGETTRIVTAMAHRGDQSWFYKLQGDDELVTAQKAAFVTFLKTVKIEESAAPAGLPDGHPAIGSGTVASGNQPTPAVAAREGGPSWSVPSGWKEVPAMQPLFAKFTIADKDGAQAAVNVSTSAGDGGGLAANVSRWCGQLGLSPWSDAQLQKNVKEVAATGGKAMFVEMSGTDGRTGKPAALVGAMVSHGGSAWFYKLMGDAKIVEAQKEAFTKFVKEVKY